jgi:protein-S-isoprenylcysteine O-methyltransferase Ste14
MRLMSSLESKVPPPAVVLLTALLMWVAAHAVPQLGFDVPGLKWFGVALGVAGFVTGATGVVSFRRAKTTVNPMRLRSSSSLVASGVYAITRNPMYLGGLIMLVGWALFLLNALPFTLLPAYVLYIDRFQIVPEERALTSLFGDKYIAYQRRVRRWL